MINELIGTVLQVLIFMLIPFCVYLIKEKKAKGFFSYIGLKKSTTKANGLAILGCLLFAGPAIFLCISNESFRQIMFDPNSITGKFRELGFSVSSFSLLLLIALVKTSFTEEVLFRGFIAKRLISIMGYKKGNLLQAFIFGIIHSILFAFTTTNIYFLIIIFIFPAIGSYLTVYLNEKLANGSIIPGWIAHGLANVIAYSYVGFLA